VNNDAANPDCLGCTRHAARGIPEKGATDAAPLPIVIHS
jgi:hypothetical protein